MPYSKKDHKVRFIFQDGSALEGEWRSGSSGNLFMLFELANNDYKTYEYEIYHEYDSQGKVHMYWISEMEGEGRLEHRMVRK